jgi:hypothetical protein
LPDEDELEIDDDGQALVEDALLVETLMGWDGDPCRCAECACSRFLDVADARLCARLPREQ